MTSILKLPNLKQRPIDKPTFLPIIRHGSTDSQLRLVLFHVNLETLCLQIFFGLHFYGNNRIPFLNDKINFCLSRLGSPIMRNAIACCRYQLLTNILLSQRSLEIDKESIPVQIGLNIDLIQKSIDIKLKIVEQDRQDESERHLCEMRLPWKISWREK